MPLLTESRDTITPITLYLEETHASSQTVEAVGMLAMFVLSIFNHMLPLHPHIDSNQTMEAVGRIPLAMPSKLSTNQSVLDDEYGQSDCGSGGDVGDGHAVQGRHPLHAQPVLVGQMQGADEAQVHAEVRQVVHAVFGGQAGEDALEGEPRVGGGGVALRVVLLPHDVPQGLLQRPNVHLK